MTEASDTPRGLRALRVGAVRHAPWPISQPRRLYQLVRNPLRLEPAEAYHEPMVVRARQGTARKDAWFMDPDLVESLLGAGASHLEKSEFEKRVLALMVGDGLLTSDGALWRWQRRTIAPLFRPAAMSAHVETMASVSEEVVAAWRAEGDRVRAIDGDMTDVTAATVMRTMQASARSDERLLVKTESRRFIAGTAWEGAFRLMNMPGWVPNPGGRQVQRSVAALRRCMAGLIARKRQELDGDEAAAGDLISQLIRARDPETGAAMTDAQLVNNLLTIVEAGYETTATSLTWTLYLLARSPEWQARLRTEIRETIGDRRIGAADLPRLVLTQQVYKEALRLFPPGSTIGRVFVRPMDIAGQRFEAGDAAMFPVYCIHRHRRLWDDPDRFDPTRFAEPGERALRKGQFMPFGVGARTCIGNLFAMTEATVVLASLIRSARFHWTGAADPEPVARVTLRPRGGMRLAVEWLAPSCAPGAADRRIGLGDRPRFR